MFFLFQSNNDRCFFIVCFTIQNQEKKTSVQHSITDHDHNKNNNNNKMRENIKKKQTMNLYIKISYVGYYDKFVSKLTSE